MDLERKTGVTARNGVIAGSVWETRMKSDDVRGGFKVFNADQNSQENVTSDHNNSNSTANNNEIQVHKRLSPKQSVLAGANAGKRKTWKSENSDGFERSPVQISKKRSEKEKNLDDKCRELSVSADGIKRSPVQIKKTRSEAGKELSVSVDGLDRSPIHRMRTRAMWQRLSGEASDGIERNSISLRKLKSEPTKGVEEGSVGLRKSKSEGNERNSIPPVKGIGRNSVELRKEDDHFEESVEETEKSPVGIKESRSAESLDEFDVCEEKVITTDLDSSGQVKFDDDEDDWDEEMEEAVEEEIEKKSIVVKEMNVSSEEQKPISPIIGKQVSPPVVVAEKKILQRNERAAPISAIVRKQPPPVVNHPRVISKPTNTNPTQESDESQKVPGTHSKLRSLVDLVMWRDASRSAFIFGIGTFSIISSSYTKDLNISFISVVSYLGLVYLAAIFLFRSIINRGAVDTDDENQEHVVGEEEAIWILKLILPYINEFLLNVRALFSGDPATTMKLAVLLFVLARCGSSITIWKMAKFGFFGVFTVPKVCSSYSHQLTAFGTFWVRRFRDAWESCTHKKAVAFAIFTVVWNLSSVVARIWAVFMLFVAFKYYQQSLMREEWMDEDADSVTGGGQDPWQGQMRGQRQGRTGPTFMENSQKLKKRS